MNVDEEFYDEITATLLEEDYQLDSIPTKNKDGISHDTKPPDDVKDKKKKRNQPTLTASEKAISKKSKLAVNLSKDPKYKLQLKYPDMLHDAFNSGDMSQLETFLRQYCTPDCKMMAYERRENEQISQDENIDYITFTYDLEGTINGWKRVLISWPDGYYRNKDVKIRSLPDNNLAVVCGYTFTGTQVYKALPVLDEAGKPTDFPKNQSLPDMEYVVKVTNATSVQSSVQAIGTLTLPFSEDGKIKAFQHYYSFVGQRPSEGTILNWPSSSSSSSSSSSLSSSSSSSSSTTNE